MARKFCGISCNRHQGRVNIQRADFRRRVKLQTNCIVNSMFFLYLLTHTHTHTHTPPAIRATLLVHALQKQTPQSSTWITRDFYLYKDTFCTLSTTYHKALQATQDTRCRDRAVNQGRAQPLNSTPTHHHCHNRYLLSTRLFLDCKLQIISSQEQTGCSSCFSEKTLLC